MVAAAAAAAVGGVGDDGAVAIFSTGLSLRGIAPEAAAIGAGKENQVSGEAAEGTAAEAVEEEVVVVGAAEAEAVLPKATIQHRSHFLSVIGQQRHRN